MPMINPPEPSSQRRRLGRSRAYTGADLPKRLLAWHAPRANRWEYFAVECGALRVEWLGADGIRSESFPAGSGRWIPPGTRWRVAGLAADTRFVLEIHADEATPAAAPQALRAALLDEAPQMRVGNGRELASALETLEPGGRCLIHAEFDIAPAIADAVREHAFRLCWHPLQAGEDGWVTLVARLAAPIGLAEYLARDHAVIEAALARALRGAPEGERWLRNALGRHLVIEEELLFPPWLAAGGNPGWVRGLCNEHRHLRRAIEHLDDPVARRRFLLLLDGHDEKEEQIVYPDLVARLGNAVEGLLRQVMVEGLRAEGWHQLAAD
ncbi:MAG: hemerythrin domain-containing protein [Xanthomonadales bacterium]|nr:hemerythrin domain-containing protein [Xanthomonadales bacterium]